MIIDKQNYKPAVMIAAFWNNNKKSTILTLIPTYQLGQTYNI
jgi:hypothetical protein